ncbi:MAG: DNA-binding NtrC family response regulator [Roseivirga sp.]
MNKRERLPWLNETVFSSLVKEQIIDAMKIILVDDQINFLDGLTKIIQEGKMLEVIAAVSNIPDAIIAIDKNQPGLVMMD